MRIPLLAAALATAPIAAGAADTAATALTVFGGYRGGGSFTESTSGKAFSLDATPAWAVTVDRAIDARGRVISGLHHRQHRKRQRRDPGFLPFKRADRDARARQRRFIARLLLGAQPA